MCSNYTPPDPDELADLSLDLFDRELPVTGSSFGAAYPGSVAPFLSNAEPDEWLLGMFGMVPHWGDPIKLSRMTYNCRTETVAEKPSFRNAWKQRQFALIPVRNFFEPSYESGRAVRWRIERADGRPFLLAGIWERRLHDDGPARRSFSMLTISADEHPLMRRFHKPGDEKRSVVVLDPADCEGWLNARTEADVRAYLRPFDPHLMTASASPAPPRRPDPRAQSSQ